MNLQAKSRLLASLEFKYGLVNRPPGIGAVPNGYIAYDRENLPRTRHGVLTYPHALTDAQVRQYELIPLSDEHGNDLVLPRLPGNLFAECKDAADTLNYLKGETLDEDQQAYAAECQSVIDKATAWARANGLNPHLLAKELGL